MIKHHHQAIMENGKMYIGIITEWGKGRVTSWMQPTTDKELFFKFERLMLEEGE